MKAYLFNEEEEMINISIKFYTYSIDVVEDNIKGTYDTQETIIFYPVNYDKVVKFLKQSGNEINFASYDYDNKLYLNQPYVEYGEGKISLVKVKTFFY